MTHVVSALGELAPPDGTPWWAWALVVVLIATIPAAIAILAQHPLKRTMRTVAKDARESREQVKNSHGSNLRDDVDRLLASIREVRQSVEHVATEQRWQRETQTQIAHDIGGLREEIRTERKDRATGDEMVIDTLTRRERERRDRER